LSAVLDLHPSPHIVSGNSVERIMRNVVCALMPVAGFAVFAFGLSGLLTLLTATLCCLATEYALDRIATRPSRVTDGSALVTGLLFGLTLPPTLPLWMVVVGGVFAVGVGKQLFGGLGSNCFNPALVGRAFLQAAFPQAMTTWNAALLPDRFHSISARTFTPPLSQPLSGPDGMTAATPLSAWKFEGATSDTWQLMVGMTDGSLGETSALLILLGGAWLMARRMMNWRITIAMLASVAVLSGLLHGWDPVRYAGAPFMLFSGGLMLGAVFMATDMVASPMTGRGCAVYGALIGVIVVVIRVWGGMPEGVMYAILLGNAASPHIDRMTQHRVFGTARSGLQTRSTTTP
jgi:Na+-translocating ferredoxin:NAD+ oxidoreductase subunit D